MSIHATTQTDSGSSATQRSLPVPAAAMENLAARARSAGLFVMLLRPDGPVTYHDESAPVFFQRFVLPLAGAPGAKLTRRAASLEPDSPVATWDLIPGVSLAAFPHVERRRVSGVILVAAKAEGFSLSEDVLRECGRLGIDGLWLMQQAGQLPAYGADAIGRQAELLQGVLRDQLRLGGLELELDSLSNQLSNTYEELSLIYQLSSGMKINRRADDFFKQACLDVMEVMSVRAMGVTLGGGTLRHEPALYGGLSLPAPKLKRLAEELTTILKHRKTPLLVNHLFKDKTFGWLAEHAQQLLAVPLQRQDQILGAMFALDKSAGEFDTVDSKLLNSIANESAIYLENSMLYEDVRGLMMGLLHSLTSAVDAKDTYTCGHSERVALLSRCLAQQIPLDDHAVDRVYMAGLLHDVGKIGVPEAVLQKAGRLTPEEFEEIKKHPAIGARILRDIRQIEDIIPGVLYHHERYDGKGYPAGLAGEEIPLLGRIICLADCFDAMTSSRTYRKALPLEVAMTEIKRCAGTQFDPALADAFLRIGAEQFREVLAHHQERAKEFIEVQQRRLVRSAV
jgi:HD-GYP domain-containing protein (c-di-GMP phosphodiesterase class II)